MQIIEFDGDKEIIVGHITLEHAEYCGCELVDYIQEDAICEFEDSEMYELRTILEDENDVENFYDWS